MISGLPESVVKGIAIAQLEQHKAKIHEARLHTQALSRDLAQLFRKDHRFAKIDGELADLEKLATDALKALRGQ